MVCASRWTIGFEPVCWGPLEVLSSIKELSVGKIRGSLLPRVESLGRQLVMLEGEFLLH